MSGNATNQELTDLGFHGSSPFAARWRSGFGALLA
jgi:hypothetical protein